MKKILIILPIFPYPLNSGGNIGVFEMIDYCRNRFNITIILPDSALDFKIQLEEKWPNVVFVYYKKDLIIYRVLRKLRLYTKLIQFNITTSPYLKEFSSNLELPDALTSNTSMNLIKTVKKVTKGTKFDFIQTEFYDLIDLIDYLPYGVKTVFIHHELKFVRCERISLSNSIKFYNHSSIEKIRLREEYYTKQYNYIITVSNVDRDILRKEFRINENRLFASPLTIKGNQSVANKSSYIFKNELVYLGGSKHYPNYDALKWFLQTCWLDILQKQPNLKLKVVGEWLPNHRLELSKYPNLTFTGFVDSLSDEIFNSIMIIPLRIGSGMRMKIIEAVNYNVPFITTSVGCEGLEFTHNHDCIIADDSISFINAVLRLVSDKELQLSIIEKAKETLEKNYSHQRLTLLRESIYNTICND